MQIRPAQVAAAAQLAGLAFTPEECELMCAALSEQAASYTLIRHVPLPNSLPPAMAPDRRTRAAYAARRRACRSAHACPPANPTALAFASVATLANSCARARCGASELTELYLARLHQYDQRPYTV